MRLPLVAAVLFTVTAAHADKFTHTGEVKPKVTLTERSKPVPKHEEPAAPSVSSTQILQVEGLLGTIHSEQIDILQNELIPNTPDDDVEDKADLYFRLGEIFAKQQRFHRLKAVENDLAIAREHNAPKKAALTREMTGHQKEAKDALVAAIRTYQKLTDNPKFANTAKIDTALFYFAWTLQNAGYIKEARDAYDKLLKNYPKSKYVPEAHLAFAEFFFETKQLADAEAKYRLVLKFPKSSVYRFAQYKLGWVDFNLSKFADAMELFNEVVQATKNVPDKAVLHRAAKADFVRAYAEIGKADKALVAFRRVSGGDGIDMLETLADLYQNKGMSEKAIYSLRELMTERPKSPKVCLWEHSVARAMLSAGTFDDRATEIEKLVKLYTVVGSTLPKAEASECREAAAEMSGMYARAFHEEGAKTKSSELLRIAGRLYRAYLTGFPGAKDYAETQYFHAELSWLFAELETNPRLAVQKWSDAAQAFTETLDKGKLSPRLVQVAADAAMLARMKEQHIDPRVQHVAVADSAYDTVAVPKLIPPQDAKLLAAYDTYLKYVKDPKDDERIDVMFHRANLLRRYDHFSDALPALESIALEHGSHETAPWAAQLALDSYNRLKNYDGMFAFVDRLPENIGAKWPVVEVTIKGLRRQGIRKQAEKLEAEAKATGDLTKYVACGAKYLEAYNKDPLADDADQLLYNAGVCYESGKSLSAAMGMYSLLQQLFPKSTLTAKSLVRHGNVLASVAFYKEAAEKFEEYATRYAGMDNAFGPLSDAVVFRKGIGDDAKALADTRQFVILYGTKKKAEAASAYFSMTSIYEKQGDQDKLAAHLRAYLGQFGASGGTDRRIIANAKLGQALWQASCPVPTIDGACMKMTRAASTGRKLRIRSEAIPKRCGDETQAELTMIPRDPAKVRAAMAAFATTVAEYGKAAALGPIAGDARGAVYHYALAKFGAIERSYEQYLAMQIPSNLSFDKRQPAVAEKSRKRFETWFTRKRDLSIAMRAQYEQVINLKDGAVAIAAAARLGALSQNFSVQLFRAEIPTDQRTGPFAEDTAQTYCEELEKIATPLEVDAEANYEGCLKTSTRLGWFSEWSRACERELGQMMPDRYPKAFELRRQPDVAASILDVERAPML